VHDGHKCVTSVEKRVHVVVKFEGCVISKDDEACAISKGDEACAITKGDENE